MSLAGRKLNISPKNWKNYIQLNYFWGKITVILLNRTSTWVKLYETAALTYLFISRKGGEKLKQFVSVKIILTRSWRRIHYLPVKYNIITYTFQTTSKPSRRFIHSTWRRTHLHNVYIICTTSSLSLTIQTSFTWHMHYLHDACTLCTTSAIFFIIRAPSSRHIQNLHYMSTFLHHPNTIFMTQSPSSRRKYYLNDEFTFHTRHLREIRTHLH